MSAGIKITTEGKPGESLAKVAFENYHEELHQFLARRLPRAQDARDLVQEVFLRLLRLQRGDLVRNPQAYLYGIASRVVRDFRVRAQQERVVFDSEVVKQRSENPRYLSTDAVAEGIGIERQLEGALELLTPAQLQIFLLERCDGLSQPEIAKKLGLSPHTVKKYAVQALALIRMRCKQLNEMD